MQEVLEESLKSLSISVCSDIFHLLLALRFYVSCFFLANITKVKYGLLRGTDGVSRALLFYNSFSLSLVSSISLCVPSQWDLGLSALIRNFMSFPALIAIPIQWHFQTITKTTFSDLGEDIA